MTTTTSIPPKSQTIKENRTFFATVTVRQKLNLFFSAMVVGLLAVFFVSLQGAQNLRLHISNIYDFMFIPITAITHAETELTDIQVLLMELQSGDLTRTEQSTHFDSIRAKLESVEAILGQYEEEWLTTNSEDFSQILRQQEHLDLQEEEITTLSALSIAFEEYLAVNAQFQQDFSNGIYSDELANRSFIALKNVRENLRRLVEINNQYAELSNKAAVTQYQDNNFGLALTLVLAITVDIMLAFSISKSTSDRLSIVENAAIAYQDGYLDRRSIIDVGGNDEITRLARAFNNLFGQMQDTLITLEERVAERTAGLAAANEVSERRANQFEAISQVGSAVSSIRSLEDLLPKVTELISQHFGYYHVGIFLNDANNENAVLSAANSEGGKNMILRGHQLKIGKQGIVGYAISSGEPRTALDVGDDAVYFGNPELPNTRSELALPLKIGEAVVGALDVQSDEASAFGQEDIGVLSLLADQVSLAIENARLFDQARKSLAESEALYRQYLRQAWNRIPKEQNLAGFRYSVRGATPIENKVQDSTRVADKVVLDVPGNARISVPIAIRGETIGSLAVQVPEADAINDDQMDLVTAVAERVALSVENARLFEETTRRAERERLVSDITVKIRSTNDPDTMIETALEELKQALGATKVQLVPHTLHKTDTYHPPVEPTHQSDGETSQKRNIE